MDNAILPVLVGNAFLGFGEHKFLGFGRKTCFPGFGRGGGGKVWRKNMFSSFCGKTRFSGFWWKNVLPTFCGKMYFPTFGGTKCDTPKLGVDHTIRLGYKFRRFRNENWWIEGLHNSCGRLLMFPIFDCCLM